jgi:hypothetical protein
MGVWLLSEVAAPRPVFVSSRAGTSASVRETNNPGGTMVLLRYGRFRLSRYWLVPVTAAACATPPAPTSPQEAYNQAVQRCEQARNSSAAQPPSVVEAAFNSCMAQASTVGPK